MIGYLQGEILEHAEGKMIISVGDKALPGRVGYVVSVPQNASYLSYLPGDGVELFIHSHIREEAFDLYGFSLRSEKAFFLTLLGVNGIGPKSALAILSSTHLDQLVQAIVDEDQAFLTQIPGIGKKTAERLLVELKDGVKKKFEQGLFLEKGQHSLSRGSQKNGSGNSDWGAGATVSSGLSQTNGAVFRDAKAALISLGYRDQDIHSLLIRVMKETDLSWERTEDLIKVALRQLGSG